MALQKGAKGDPIPWIGRLRPIQASSGAPNHREAASAASSWLGAASQAQATKPSGRTSTALKPNRSLASLAT